jgi:hypothetical protein
MISMNGAARFAGSVFNWFLSLRLQGIANFCVVISILLMVFNLYTSEEVDIIVGIIIQWLFCSQPFGSFDGHYSCVVHREAGKTRSEFFNSWSAVDNFFKKRITSEGFHGCWIRRTTLRTQSVADEADTPSLLQMCQFSVNAQEVATPKAQLINSSNHLYS